MIKHNNYLVIIAALFLSAAAYGGIYNGGFEESEPNENLDFDPPAGWAALNYAAVTDHFVPVADYFKESAENWLIDVNVGLFPIEGDKFVLLSNGDMPDSNEPLYGLIEQDIIVSAGMKISGFYFFGTLDYLPYDDSCTIICVPGDASPLRPIILAQASVTSVGSHGSTPGWQYFEHVFTEGEAGDYRLCVIVSDSTDGTHDSYVAADGFALCEEPPMYGDLKTDCRVDFKDFSYLAGDWMQDCSDPNYLADPNSHCIFGTDIDDSNLVDVNDLMLMTDCWLEGE